MLSYKALSRYMIYDMKVYRNIDGVFKLFETVVLANFYDKYSQKPKKKLFSFLLFLKKKTMS